MGVLVTGGAGYIGSHTVLELLESGHEVIILDNLANSNAIAIDRVENITGKKVKKYYVDMVNIDSLEEIFAENSIESVIHFAGYKAVGESVRQPLKYYNNNIISTLNLCTIMEKYNVFNLIFSSSATVYGYPKELPIKETSNTETLNPYGSTKLIIENVLKDITNSNSNWNITLLRYFNPVGAHESGEIGEDPNSIPNNLMPYISQVAVGKLEHLEVYGSDYPTIDGTGVRDYIHVVDLARGHVKALEQINNNIGTEVYNLGTGSGYSVLQVIRSFESASGVKIPYKITDRRNGDAASSYADPSRAMEFLGWTATKNLHQMCVDTWNWQMKNPNGYKNQ